MFTVPLLGNWLKHIDLALYELITDLSQGWKVWYIAYKHLEYHPSPRGAYSGCPLFPIVDAEPLQVCVTNEVHASCTANINLIDILLAFLRVWSVANIGFCAFHCNFYRSFAVRCQNTLLYINSSLNDVNKPINFFRWNFISLEVILQLQTLGTVKLLPKVILKIHLILPSPIKALDRINLRE